MMRRNNGNGSRAALAQGFMAFCATVAMGLASMVSPAAAAPFAYVANTGADTVSVIDTATNMVVATIPAGSHPLGVAATRMGHTPMSRTQTPTPFR